MFGRVIWDKLPKYIFGNFEIARENEGNFKIFINHEGDCPKMARTKHVVTG